MDIIENKTFDMERALYGSRDIAVKNCRFDGPADGESAFKECSNIEARNCYFNLRYPFWHDHGLKIISSDMTSCAGQHSGTLTILKSRTQRCMASKRCASAHTL